MNIIEETTYKVQLTAGERYVLASRLSCYSLGTLTYNDLNNHVETLMTDAYLKGLKNSGCICCRKEP